MVAYTYSCSIKVLMRMLTASLLRADSEAPLACRRPSEEKLVREVPGRSCTWAKSAMHSCPMVPARAHAAARLLFFEALAAYSLPRPG